MRSSSSKLSFSMTMVAAVLLFFSGSDDFEKLNAVLANHVGGSNDINTYIEYGFYQVVSDCLDRSSVGDCAGNWYSEEQGGKTLLDWDVSMIKDMSDAFAYQYTFNGDLSKWDVSSVTRFERMFNYATSYEGVGVETWDTSNAESMQDMFWEATKFNGKVSGWNTNKVINMKWMFDKAKSFAQDVSGWTKHDGNSQCGYFGSNYDFSCTGGVGADTSLMFLDAEAFLASYNCGVNGPPKACTPSGNEVSAGFTEYTPASTFDPSVYTVEWFNSEAASDYYTLDDSTIWGTPRLDVQSGETITDMKFELNEEYAKMIGGCVLPGVLVAVFMFVFTLLFFAFKFATCCIWVVTGSCECCLRSKIPTASEKTFAKCVVVVCALISIVGCGLIYWGASELPLAVSDVVKELSDSLNILTSDVDIIDAAYTNSAALIPDGGQDEKVQISNTVASVQSTVSTFENEVEMYVEQTEQAAIALATFLLVNSLICGGLVFGNFKKCLFFASITLWLFMLVSWIMFGVFMGVAQFFDDLETTVIDWRSAEGFYPPAANPMTSLDDVLPCFSDRVALDTITGARETIYEGINNLNTKLNINNVNADYDYINAEYNKTTALEMCGEKTLTFNEIGVSSENLAYDEYKALACNLHERGLLLDGDVAFDATNAAGYDQKWSGVWKSHTISLQDASGFYSMSPYNYVLPISDVSGTIDMINALPNIDSLARCKYVQSFVAKVAAEQQDYVDPITGETIQAPDDSPLNRLLIHSQTLAVAWFLIGLSYIILYVVMMKYMYWMQAEDKEKLSEEEMKEVWGSYHE
ncbi:unnamed protein product [Bathycoccus prasinos]